MSKESLELPCLKLNKNWSPISIISARKAFEDASAGAVTFLKFQDNYPSIFRLEDWLKLEVEEGEDYVTTSRMHGLKKIGIPRVVICTSYDKLLVKSQPCTPENLLKRYGYKDAVTGRKLQRENFSKEHVRPKSRGGSSGWDNLVPMDRKLNSERGNKSYRKIGFKQPKIIGAPRPILPINALVNKNRYPEWKMLGIRDPED